MVVRRPPKRKTKADPICYLLPPSAPDLQARIFAFAALDDSRFNRIRPQYTRRPLFSFPDRVSISEEASEAFCRILRAEHRLHPSTLDETRSSRAELTKIRR